MKEVLAMISERMIAPCGLDCALCKYAHNKEKPCHGCLSTDGSKPDFCETKCSVVHCDVRRTLADRFCDTCEKYPCQKMMELELRYANKYELVESPMGNLDLIRREGMDAFLTKERKRWLCGDCGGVVCVHTGVCADCGRQYSDRRK